MIISRLKKIERLRTVKRKLSTFIHKVSLFQLMSVRYGFIDEKRTVYKGIRKHLQGNEVAHLSTLRRNVHRIEKGLITIPVKPVFAESYIGETILSFKEVLKNKKNENSIIWATNILNAYFEVVQMTPIIEQSKTAFLALARDVKDNLVKLPYTSKDRIQNTVSYEDFLNLNYHRRSVRYYTDEKVDRKLIEKAVDAALQSPSACNRQPFYLKVIDDPELIKKAVLLPPGVATFAHNISTMIFVIGDLSCYFDNRDKHLIYIDGGLFVMNFVLALETLGLSSCIINWPDIRSKNKKLASLFDLPDEQHCVTVLSIGFPDPDGGIPTSIKKDKKDIIKYNIE